MNLPNEPSFNCLHRRTCAHTQGKKKPLKSLGQINFDTPDEGKVKLLFLEATSGRSPIVVLNPFLFLCQVPSINHIFLK